MWLVGMTTKTMKLDITMKRLEMSSTFPGKAIRSKDVRINYCHHSDTRNRFA